MSCLELYDRDAAVAYARQYALSYNPQYANYKSSTGAAGRGDCMNFVSQCLHAGGMPIKQQGFLWYGAKSGSSASWKGVDSFLAYIRQSFGSPRLLFECYATPENLKRGDIVFSVASGDAGDISRNPSHIVILSEDYATYGKLVVCGHTKDERDADKTANNSICTYIHIPDESIQYDYIDPDYEDETDKTTEKADFGKTTLKRSNTATQAVRNLQTRLNYLGFSSGTVDGKYGANTENAVKAFQTACVPRFGLTVDGIAGQATKEALIYPYAWSH